MSFIVFPGNRSKSFFRKELQKADTVDLDEGSVPRPEPRPPIYCY